MKIVTLVTAIIIGLVFVYFPRQNTPPTGLTTGSVNGVSYDLCTGADQPGIKKIGLPLIAKTTYTGGCTAGYEPKLAIGAAAIDFIVGAVAGSGVVWLASRVIRSRKSI